jgi:amino acid transporter
VFALLGFEQAVQLGGESKNPKRDLPRAVIFSILIGATIYILVQLMFIAALKPSVLAEAKTWANLGPTNHNAAVVLLNQAPFYQVAELAGLAWLAFFLRLDAVISPSGTGLIYLTSASRISFGLSKNGYIPDVFERNHPRYRVPWWSLVITFLIGLIFLGPFKSWAALVGVITSASVMMYAAAPLSLGALRRSKPNLPRVFSLPAGHILAPASFVLANFIVYWAGWGVYSTLMIVMILGYILMAISARFKLNPNTPAVDWGSAPWLLSYLIGMGVISFLGSFPGSPGVGIVAGQKVFGVNFANVLVGGKGHIGLYWDLLVLTIFSLVIYFWAIHSRLPEAKVDEYVRDVYPGEAASH